MTSEQSIGASTIFLQLVLNTTGLPVELGGRQNSPIYRGELLLFKFFPSSRGFGG